LNNIFISILGYLNSDSADKAINELNNTYIDTSKIQVSSAMTKDNLELPRAWSKWSKGSSAYDKKHGIV